MRLRCESAQRCDDRLIEGRLSVFCRNSDVNRSKVDIRRRDAGNTRTLRTLRTLRLRRLK